MNLREITRRMDDARFDGITKEQMRQGLAKTGFVEIKPGVWIIPEGDNHGK